ncbi:hypothetical protein SAMN05444369_101270 [Capnocytophaga haemolytica]|uniref:Uncharacterized protein n=1 Tax=Capnocytophaga haemolytica TaxID=45243 RepID=A0AAX2GY87_9FLAO|nr:hypothetical protein SAMN05444369_101270 [Capnocytophaga haemolytica]SNV04757.1 Uncharacterised protein [Capnocytophaga haemolytica]
MFIYVYFSRLNSGGKFVIFFEMNKEKILKFKEKFVSR